MFHVLKFAQNIICIDIDYKTIGYIATISILFVLLLVLLITFLVAKRRNRKWRSSMVDKTASTRVYCFDQYKNEVKYFNLSSISRVKTTTFEGFYSSLPLYEAPKVRDWIDSHLEGKEGTPYFLPTEILVHGEKRTLKSFLRVTKLDKTTNKLHVESHIIHYDGPTTSFEKNFSTVDELGFAIERNGYETGMTFCFSLFPKKEGVRPEMDHLACDRFVKEILRNVTGNQLVLKASKTEIIVANFDMREYSQAMAYALQLNYKASKEANAKRRGTPIYEVKAGVVSNKELNGNVDIIITEVRKTAENAYINKASVNFYNRNSSSLSAAEESSYKTEVERIVTNNRLVASYRPIVKTENAAIIGYFGKITPLNTTFGKIEELQNYALRANDSGTLFNAMSRIIVSKFKRESKEISKKALTLYYPMRTQEKDLALEFFKTVEQGKSIKLNFVYSDKDVSSFCSHNGVDEMIEFMNKLKEMKIGFSIEFNNRSLNIDKRILSKASSFVVDFGNNSGVVIDTKTRSDIYNLVSKLLIYKKQIIASNLNSWNAIELVVSSGIEIVSADPILPYDTMFKPLSERRMGRITSIKKN